MKSPIPVKVAEVAVLVKMDVIIGRKLSVNQVAAGGFHLIVSATPTPQ